MASKTHWMVSPLVLIDSNGTKDLVCLPGGHVSSVLASCYCSLDAGRLI